MDHRHHRNAGGGQARQPAEEAAAVDEVLDAVLQQVGAGGFDQVQEGQPVLLRDGDDAQDLLQAHRLDGAGVDAGIGGGDHAAHAGDVADAGDEAAAGNGLGRVGVVQAPTGDGGELEEGRTGVERPRHALARQQLAAPVEDGPGLRRGVAHALFEGTEVGDERQPGFAVGGEGGGRRVEIGVEDGHGNALVIPSPRVRGEG